MNSSELDAVDRLLLADAGPLPERIAIIDAPALASSLADREGVVAWCDDWTAHHALPRQVAVDPYTLGTIDLGLYRLPKSLGELDEIAGLVAAAGGRLLAGARIKHLTRSMNSVLSRHFDAVTASLGVAKARVLRGIGPHPQPNPWPKKRHHLDHDLWLAAHGGTFGGTKIDPGTRLLIDHLGQVNGDRIVDLGCGNGTLAALLARAGRSVVATDSSWAGVEATRATAALNEIPIEVVWADGLDAIPDASADAIVCNPPFHDDRAKDSAATLRMFADASRALSSGGELWCVFNSHLPWRRELSRLVGSTQLVAQNPKYTLTRSVVA